METELFQGVVPFVAVAEEGTFRGAARRLGVTPAAVSQAIARLEDQLGVRLFNRTTRRVAITHEGDAFLLRCRAAIEELRAGRALVEAASDRVRGPLTVSASVILRGYLAPRLSRFAGLYPEVDLHLRFSDRQARLVDEGVDVAFRIGELDDSALRARRLFGTTWVTVAAPAYLERFGRPARVDDLETHRCLVYSRPNGMLSPWTCASGPFSPRAHATVDDGEALVQLAAAGMGLAHVFRFLVEDRLHDGRLVQVMHDESVEGPPVWMLSVDGAASNARLRAFTDFFGVSS